MALRCLATPNPLRYLLSASASAALTCKIFSASAFSAAASRRRADALIWFMAFFTCTSGSRSTTNAAIISYPYSLIWLASWFRTDDATSSLDANASSSSIRGKLLRITSNTYERICAAGSVSL